MRCRRIGEDFIEEEGVDVTSQLMINSFIVFLDMISLKEWK